MAGSPPYTPERPDRHHSGRDAEGERCTAEGTEETEGKRGGATAEDAEDAEEMEDVESVEVLARVDLGENRVCRVF